MSTQINSIIENILSSTNNNHDKIQELCKLTETFKEHVGISFLNIYSTLYNEYNNPFLSKDISRVLSCSFPFDTAEFLELMKQNPNSLKSTIEVFHKFSNTFPMTHSQTTDYFCLPLMFSALILGNAEDFNKAVSISPSFFRSSKFLSKFSNILTSVLKSQRYDGVYTLYNTFPEQFDYAIALILIDHGFPDFKFIENLIPSNTSCKISLNNQEITTDIFTFICLKFINENSSYSEELFKYFSSYNNYSLKNSITLSSKEVPLMSFIGKSKFSGESVIKFFTYMLTKEIDDVDLMLIIRHYVHYDFKSFINFCSTPFFKDLFNHPSISSPFFNRELLMSNLLKLELSYNYDAYIKEKSIFIRPAIAILNELVRKFPDDFNKIKIHKDFFPTTNSDSKNKNLIIESLSIDIQNLVKRSLLNSMDELVKTPIQSFEPVAIQSLLSLGFIYPIQNEKNRFWNKNNSGEIVRYEWDVAFMEKQLSKTTTTSHNQIDIFTFLVGDNDSPLTTQMIDIIYSEETRQITKNIVLMSLQFKELDLENSNTEEFYFMNQQLGRMINKILKTYQDYKTYDPDIAETTLKTQMLMLQKKTSKAIDVIFLEDKNRILFNTKVNNHFINKSLDAME